MCDVGDVQFGIWDGNCAEFYCVGDDVGVVRRSVWWLVLMVVKGSF